MFCMLNSYDKAFFNGTIYDLDFIVLKFCLSL